MLRIMYSIFSAYFFIFTFLSHLILLSFSLASSEHIATGSHSIIPGREFVSGKTVEYLPNPIFYDSYIPILFKIPIPKHTEGALKLIWGDVESCTKSAKGKLCPVAYHLFKVTKKLANDMNFWKPYYVNHTGTMKEASKKRTGYEIICNEISPHFFRSYSSTSQLKNYIIALRACSRIAQNLHVENSTENWVVDKAVYYKMLESFKIEYFNALPQKGNVDWAVTQNMYTSVNGLLLTNHVMESVRLATAFRICQSGLIPETFISMAMLKEELEKTHYLGRWNYKLVYPNLEQDIEEYYKLPLADCTFSDDFSFIIRILAPIRQSEVSHRLVQITTIPFLEKLSNTTGIPERLCRLKLPAPKLTLIETSMGLLLDTSCEPNQLCKTSEVSTVFETDACTASILSDNRQLIENTCKFSCFTVDPITLPIIRRISSDTYVVVGSSDTKIHLNCYDKPEELIPIHLKNIGALRIKLACNCHLLYSTHVSYRPREPCSGKTSVEHILPYHWYDKSVNLNENATSTSGKYEDFDERKDVVVHNDTVKPDNPGNPTDIEDAQIEKSVAKQEEELENEFKNRKPEVTPKIVKTHLHNHEMSGGVVAQLCILWILVVVLAASTLYLGYHVRKLMKWRELQSYKETRIVYSIPKTPDENKIVNKF